MRCRLHSAVRSRAKRCSLCGSESPTPRTERAAFYNRNLVLVEQPRAGLGGDDGFNGEGNLFSRFGKRVPIYSGTSPGHALLLLAHSDALVSS